jgi:hypothetical protein
LELSVAIACQVGAWVEQWRIIGPSYTATVDCICLNSEKSRASTVDGD